MKPAYRVYPENVVGINIIEMVAYEMIVHSTVIMISIKPVEIIKDEIPPEPETAPPKRIWDPSI